MLKHCSRVWAIIISRRKAHSTPASRILGLIRLRVALHRLLVEMINMMPCRLMQAPEPDPLEMMIDR